MSLRPTQGATDVAYEATSLDDIANTFDEFSQQADRQCEQVAPGSRRERTLNTEARIWSTAARMLRATKLVKEDVQQAR